MLLVDMAPYIIGRAFSRDAKPPIRCTSEMFQRALEVAACSDTFAATVQYCETPKDFYRLEPDIEAFIPLSEREEVFYCLKNEMYSPAVPAKCIYYIKKIYNMYNIPSLVWKCLPVATLTIFFQGNYLDQGLTLKDVINSFCDSNYVPLSTQNLSSKIKDGTEIYVPNTDMVAVVPTNIANKLSYDDLHKVQYVTEGVSVGDSPIRFMSGYHGACRSAYDLRTLV